MKNIKNHKKVKNLRLGLNNGKEFKYIKAFYNIL